MEGFDRKIFCKIYISVTEAVSNAIKHGNGLDNSKFVEILFNKYDHGYEFIISDQGKGFDYTEVPDPTKNENLNRESGRGIFLMKKYSDQVLFDKQGSTVTLLFIR